MSKLALFFSALALLLVSSQAQLTANVCNSGECRFGQCEVTSASTFACHCSAVSTNEATLLFLCVQVKHHPVN